MQGACDPAATVVEMKDAPANALIADPKRSPQREQQNAAGRVPLAEPAFESTVAKRRTITTPLSARAWRLDGRPWPCCTRRVPVRCARSDRGRGDRGPKGFRGQSPLGIARRWRLRPQHRERLARAASCAPGRSRAPCCLAGARRGRAAARGHARGGTPCRRAGASTRLGSRRSCMHESYARRSPDHGGGGRSTPGFPGLFVAKEAASPARVGGSPA
jgi:hypothetical protein